MRGHGPGPHADIEADDASGRPIPNARGATSPSMEGGAKAGGAERRAVKTDPPERTCESTDQIALTW